MKQFDIQRRGDSLCIFEMLDGIAINEPIATFHISDRDKAYRRLSDLQQIEHLERLEKESTSPRLTDDERAVLELLKRAYEAYIELPEYHPMHQDEFCRAIHQCQRLVMSRPTARVEGWIK